MGGGRAVRVPASQASKGVWVRSIPGLTVMIPHIKTGLPSRHPRESLILFFLII